MTVQTGTFWTCTRRRVEWTHGFFFFLASHTRHTTTQHKTTTRPQHHTETETETDRDRERRQGQRERREDGRGETRQKKTREEKRRDKMKKREKKHGRSYLVEWIVWLISLTTETFCLLCSVKYDSYLITGFIVQSAHFQKLPLPVLFFRRSFLSGNFDRFYFSERQFRIWKNYLLPVFFLRI